ncbi:MAG: CHASE2 domain-containing protein [Acidiferrobacterales bacterium]
MITAKKIGFLLTGVVLIMYLLGNQLLDVMELKTYDMRLRSQGVRAPVGNVVIAAIDEKSLAELGRWPWSRRTMASLIEKLDGLGARVIALDVFFSESENQKLLDHIEKLEKQRGFTDRTSPYQSIKRTLAADLTLSEAIAKSGKITLGMVFFMLEDEVRQLPKAKSEKVLADIKDQAIRIFRDDGDGNLDFPMPEPAGLLVNLPEIRANAKYTGHIVTVPDLDGTLRWAPLVIRYKGLFFPSADVQAARAALNVNELILHTTEYGITGLAIGDRFISTDEFGRALIHYHGPEQTVATLSVSDIYRGSVKPELIKDKIVLIGATAKGIGDIRVTPYGPTYPGVEIRANIIQNLLDSDFINRPEWMRLIDAIVIVGLGSLLSWMLSRIDMWRGAVLAATSFGLYTLIAVIMFRVQLVWLNIVYPSVLVLLLFVVSTIAKYVRAETVRRQTKSAFQHYVSPKLVDEIMGDVDRLRLGGEERTLTVLFSDIRGFTSVSQSLPPEDVVRLLNVYLTQMTEKVFKHDGLLDKYIGDAIMAVYGAPIYRQDHAILACRTALDMLDQLHELQAGWEQEELPILDIGIGINTGPMIIGNMGSKGSINRFDYTVIGDAVNLGSRIEGLNKTYGTHILMSEFTYEHVREEFPYMREVELAQVRGRRELVRIYELLHTDGQTSMDWVDEFRRAYELVRRNEFDQALPIFEHLYETVHDPVSKYYLECCRAPAAREYS